MWAGGFNENRKYIIKSKINHIQLGPSVVISPVREVKLLNSEPIIMLFLPRWSEESALGEFFCLESKTALDRNPR